MKQQMIWGSLWYDGPIKQEFLSLRLMNPQGILSHLKLFRAHWTTQKYGHKMLFIDFMLS